MRKSRLGRTNLEVSRWGLGGIALSTIMGGSDEEAVFQVIDAAMDYGVNIIDTARIYMDSEENIGQALSKRKDKPVLASKSLSRKSDEIFEDIEDSLEDLQCGKIEIYQIHDLGPDEISTVMGKGGALEGLQKARDAGLIDFIGITSHHTSVCLDLINTDEFDTVMFPFNVIEREPEKELLSAAKEKDIGTFVMKPIAGGSIGNIKMAFRFFNSYSVDVVLNGVANLNEFNCNIKCSEDQAPLSTEELVDFEKEVEHLGRQFCRRCNYCMPCTSDIVIPPMIHVMHQNITGKKPADLLIWYEACEECGKCEERCPYDLPTIKRKNELIGFFSSL